MENKKYRDYKIHLCISHEGKTYKCCTLGFMSDGGYFLSDLGHEEEYLATKIYFDGKSFRKEIKIKHDYDNTYSIVLTKPKISHHVDGNAHISGTNITRRKLHIKTINLSKENDGGPMFIFNIGIKKLEEFPLLIVPTDIDIVFSDPFIRDARQKTKESFNYHIEGFYLLKSRFFVSGTIPNTITITHPAYGTLTLTTIRTPDTTPGIFGVGCVRDPLGSNDDFFSLNGAPGIIDKNGGNYGISLMPKNKPINREFKSLNYDNGSSLSSN